MNETNHPALRLRHGDRPTEPLTFADDAANKAGTLCRDDGACQYAIDRGAGGNGSCPDGLCCMPRTPAANKAAEEGEHYAMQARRFCKGDNAWTDWRTITSAEYERRKDDSMFEFKELSEMVKQVVAADRASRQVANKAEVEILTEALKDCARHPRLAQRENIVSKALAKVATPPATTGASTAPVNSVALNLEAQLRDVVRQRDALAAAIRDAAVKAGIASAGAGLTGPHLLMLADDMASVIAAQAGQVAVPYLLDGHKAVDVLRKAMDSAELPDEGRGVLIGYFCNEWNAATSPAKESK